MMKKRGEINRALASAKSIRLEHFRSRFEAEGEEGMIAAKQLPAKDFSRLADAFPIGLDAGVVGFGLKDSCLFNPHHRIVVTDSAGNVIKISVCFECDHIGIAHDDEENIDVFPTPFAWQAGLRKFFADEGMPNSPELYRHGYEPRTAAQATSTNAAPTGAPR